mmetsp:Transcript_10119/g.17567  ORF Transcript_10119/g.17567 Transcript_10119/m.17567 type:complete len:437 (+) Transcript_10119:1265-2575(+)
MHASQQQRRTLELADKLDQSWGAHILQRLLHHAAAVHLHRQLHTLSFQQKRQRLALVRGAVLEQLLQHVVAKDIGHQTLRGGDDLVKDQLLVDVAAHLQALLDETAAVLVLAERHHVAQQVAQTPLARLAIGGAEFLNEAVAHGVDTRAAVVVPVPVTVPVVPVVAVIPVVPVVSAGIAVTVVVVIPVVAVIAAVAVVSGVVIVTVTVIAEHVTVHHIVARKQRRHAVEHPWCHHPIRHGVAVAALEVALLAVVVLVHYPRRNGVILPRGRVEHHAARVVHAHRHARHALLIHVHRHVLVVGVRSPVASRHSLLVHSRHGARKGHERRGTLHLLLLLLLQISGEAGEVRAVGGARGVHGVFLTILVVHWSVEDWLSILIQIHGLLHVVRGLGGTLRSLPSIPLLGHLLEQTLSRHGGVVSVIHGDVQHAAHGDTWG